MGLVDKVGQKGEEGKGEVGPGTGLAGSPPFPCTHHLLLPVAAGPVVPAEGWGPEADPWRGSGGRTRGASLVMGLARRF